MEKKWLLWLVLSILALSFGHAAAQDKFPGMVLVPAGEFNMGLDEAQVQKLVDTLKAMSKYFDNTTPAHKVDVAAFYIDIYEVTNEDYKKFVEATGHNIPLNWEDAGGDIPKGKEMHPVTFVNWEDADAYCKWAKKRLPAEAEWEKAARGTDGRLFPWGDKFEKKKLNYEKSRKNGTTKAGSYKDGISPYGCYDMAGNVWEWTADNYLPYPNNTKEDEFYGTERYVLRGGSFLDADYDTVSAMRSKFTKLTDDENVGFRCVKSAK
jgi:formylglycine-generating enzyme required for sulfatase activity